MLYKFFFKTMQVDIRTRRLYRKPIPIEIISDFEVVKKVLLFHCGVVRDDDVMLEDSCWLHTETFFVPKQNSKHNSHIMALSQASRHRAYLDDGFDLWVVTLAHFRFSSWKMIMAGSHEIWGSDFINLGQKNLVIFTREI